MVWGQGTVLPLNPCPSLSKQSEEDIDVLAFGKQQPKNIANPLYETSAPAPPESSCDPFTVSLHFTLGVQNAAFQQTLGEERQEQPSRVCLRQQAWKPFFCTECPSFGETAQASNQRLPVLHCMAGGGGEVSLQKVLPIAMPSSLPGQRASCLHSCLCLRSLPGDVLIWSSEEPFIHLLSW